MVFAPKLEGGVAYNQPVDTPNAMSAVAELFNFGVKSAMTKPAGSGEAKLTEDEKFSLAVREFEEAKGGTFTWDRKGMREFIFNYPQFTSQAKGFAEELGIMTAAPQEESRDALLEWAKTPEGVVAAAMTNGMSPEEGQAFMAKSFTEVMQQQAEIAKLERNAAKLTAEGTIEAKRWEALAPTQKSMVDNAVTSILGPIVQTVKDGGTVEVTPELAAMMGGNLPFTEVTMTNLPLLLSTAKMVMTTQGQQNFESNFGYSALPPDDWNASVYSSIDGLIRVAEQFDSPQEATAAMNALIEADALRKLDERGVSTAVYLAKILPPETFKLMVGDTNDMMEKLGGVLISDGGTLFPKVKIEENVANLSKSDAKSLAESTVQILSETMDEGVFTAFNAARERSGYEVMDGASFNAVIGQNATRINELAKGNAEFKAEVQDTLVSDIQQTISIIESNLIAGVNLEFDGKKFVMTPEPGTLAEQKWNDSYRPYSKSALNQLPAGLDIDALNQKVSTLGILGPMGKEVQDALGLLNETKPAASGSSRVIPKGRGRGGSTVTKSSKGGGRDVGAELGIDFATYESESGIPSGYLNKVALIESGGNPSADNPMSSAGGLFQQIDSNAAAYGVADRYDPVQATEGAVRFAVENMNYLTRVLGREPTGGELYLAHQQGPGGAAKLLSNPDALAVDIVGKKAVEQNGGNTNMTAGEFANIWISKYNGSRGQTSPAPAGSMSPSIRSDSASIDSPQRVGDGTPLDSPVQAVGGATEGLSAAEVAALVERVKEAPEKAIQVVEEAMAGKPVDPMIKALIQALVGV